MLNSIKVLIFLIVVGSGATFIGEGALADYALPMIWLSVIGIILCIIWFPFEFVKVKLAQERKAEYEEQLKAEKEEHEKEK